MLKCVNKTRRRKNKRFDNMKNMTNKKKKFMIMQLVNEAPSDIGFFLLNEVDKFIKTIVVVLHESSLGLQHVSVVGNIKN